MPIIKARCYFGDDCLRIFIFPVAETGKGGKIAKLAFVRAKRDMHIDTFGYVSGFGFLMRFTAGSCYHCLVVTPENCPVPASILAPCPASAVNSSGSVKAARIIFFVFSLALVSLAALAEPASLPAASAMEEAVPRLPDKRRPASGQSAFAAQLRNNQSLIKLMQSPSTSVDLRSVGDLIILYRRKVTDNPYDSSLRLKLGCYLYLVGDLEGAAAEIKRAVAIKPDDYLAHTLLAKVLDQALDDSTADIEFKRAIQLRPTESYAHEYYADSLFRRGEVSEAINQYRQATQLRATASAFSGLSDALLSSRDVTGAVKAARQAVSAEPSSARAHCSLTRALLLAGEYQCAQRTAREATLLDPASADAHLAMGRALYAGKNIAGACDEFRQAVKIDPLNAQARNDLGYALYGSGDVSSAVSELRLALRLNPHLSEARNNLEIAIYGLTGQKHP